MSRGLVRFSTAVLCLAALCLQTHAQSSRHPAWKAPLVAARDKQDIHYLSKVVEGQIAVGDKAAPSMTYLRALASSYLGEVYLEQGKKAEAAAAAERGIGLAREFLRADANSAEGHLLLGALCGQVIPANSFSALSYGKCAREEVETALRLNPRLSEAYLGRGVGNYYLPPALGGGVDKAIEDFRKAAELAPDSPEVQLWLGLAFRKQGDHSAARAHLERALALSPGREWIRQQLNKTPNSASK